MRSALFVPGHRRDFLGKVGRTGADGVVLDLEDSVPPERRNEARAEIARWMSLPGSARQVICVRINALEEGCLEEDLAAAVSPAVAALQVPKVRSADDILEVEAALARHEERVGLCNQAIRIWPLLETPRAVRDAFEIASSTARIAYMGGGASPNGDLARGLGIQDSGTFLETLYLRSKVLLDVRAAGCPNPMGPVTPSIGDVAALEKHARFIRSLGYEGMLVIHPSQVATVNSVFGVSEAQVRGALELIQAMEAAQKEGRGAIMHKGVMLDSAHLKSARALIRRAEEFERRQGSAGPH